MANQDIVNMMPPVKVANIAFENKGDLSFIRKSDWLPAIPSYSYGASYVDLDNAGSEDLFITREWDSPVILKNMKGKELVAQTIPDLDGLHGLWYSVIAADLVNA
jgi:hypothetical protein